MFLIRDYQLDEMTGFDGGMVYLNELFAKSNFSLSEAFDSTHCCLLPHPGKAVATSKEDTEIQIKGKKIYVVFLNNFSKKKKLNSYFDHFNLTNLNG